MSAALLAVNKKSPVDRNQPNSYARGGGVDYGTEYRGGGEKPKYDGGVEAID